MQSEKIRQDNSASTTYNNMSSANANSSQLGVARSEVELYLNNLLEVSRFKDYCPNGLQVEGIGQVKRIVTGVTASLQLIEAAIAYQADTILVHHGYFWRGEDARVVGVKHIRLRQLLLNNINLFAYHLPLDSHPEFGNNAQLAKILNLQVTERFGEAEMVWAGTCQPTTGIGLQTWVSQQLGRQALLVGDGSREVKRVAWCTGGAQGYFEDAIAQGVDAYISGEISEQTTHLARESGVVFIAAGHHATERYGVKALGEQLAKQFPIECRFIEVDNPV